MIRSIPIYNRKLALLAFLTACALTLAVVYMQPALSAYAEGESGYSGEPAESDAELVEQSVSSGSCGPNATWSYDSDTAVLTVSGTGTVTDSLWSGEKSNAEKVVVEEGITSLDPSSLGIFYSFSNMTSVSLPSTLLNIGDGTFRDCKKLKTISIPASVNSIGEYAFYGCSSLESLRLSANLKTLGQGAFWNCAALKELQIPSCTKMGELIASGCSLLSSLTLGEGVKEISNYAFQSTSLEQITIPSSVTSIGSYAFAKTKIKRIDFLGAAPSIRFYAFEDVTANAVHPANQSTWSYNTRQDYGGTLTWMIRDAKGNLMSAPYGDPFAEHIELTEGNAGTFNVPAGNYGHNENGRSEASFDFTLDKPQTVSVLVSWVGVSGYEPTMSFVNGKGEKLIAYKRFSDNAGYYSFEKDLPAGVYHVEFAGRLGYKKSSSVSCTYTIKSGESNGGGSKSPGTTKQSMHRLYNPNSGEHFYTAEDAERDNLVSLGWNDEGEGWTAPASSSTPVYRMYNPVAGEHHYTPDAAERDMLVGAGWNDEGVGWYSDDAETVPLYRDYNPNAFANNHNYTTDRSEHDYLVSLGWREEGFAWYGV